MKILKTVAKKFHKYGAKKTTCIHGHDHASQKEAMWCVKLHQLQKEGKIRSLAVEVNYDIRVKDVVICKHRLDFEYEILKDGIWVDEVTDVKGMKLPVWRLKHKLFLAVYPHINYVVV